MRRFRSFSSLRPEPQHAEKLTSLGTRRIFNEDHDAQRVVARKFFEERVAPFHAQWEKVSKRPEPGGPCQVSLPLSLRTGKFRALAGARRASKASCA